MRLRHHFRLSRLPQHVHTNPIPQILARPVLLFGWVEPREVAEMNLRRSMGIETNREMKLRSIDRSKLWQTTTSLHYYAAFPAEKCGIVVMSDEPLLSSSPHLRLSKKSSVPPPRPTRRRRLLLALVAVALVSLVGGVVKVFRRQRRRRRCVPAAPSRDVVQPR